VRPLSNPVGFIDMPKTEASHQAHVKSVDRAQAARLLLELLYRVHYIVGMKVQDTLRTNDGLDRHQTAVLWIIRSEGTDGRSISRKYVEKQLTSWYDISSSAISKSIRGLASKDIGFLNITESPNSGREKLIELTPAGVFFMQKMTRNGSAMCEWYLENMSQWESEVDVCLFIYTKITALFGKMIDAERRDAGEPVAYAAPQESVLHHPLTHVITEKSYSWDEIPTVPREYVPLMQLNIFFPIHYKAGNKLELVMRSGTDLSRQQIIILLLMFGEGENHSKMARKRIEAALSSWLELTSSSVSKAIRSLTTREVGLLTIDESPESGREKIVQLTPKGRKFVSKLVESGVNYLQTLVDQLGDDELDMVVHIFERTNAIFDSYPGPFRVG
jgi:DNA-binding MarR family transcriptional regulator